MKFSEKLLKKSLIHDVEIYPNFFSNILKVTNQNKLFIVMIWDKVIPDHIYEEIKNSLPSYQIKFITPKELSDYILKYNPWLIGYNSFHFDDVLMKALVRKPNDKKLISLMYAMTEWHINEKGSKYQYAKYKYDKCIRGIDVMRVSGLDRMFKPLKQAAANLRHTKIQDLPIKPGVNIKENQIVDIIIYELNDVLITEKILLGLPKENNSPTIPSTAYNGLLEAVNFRYSIGKHFNIDLLNFNKSQIGEKLAAKLYAKASNRSPDDFKRQQTNRNEIYYANVIFDVIEFKTDFLKKSLKKLKDLIYDPYGNKEYKKKFKFEFDLFDLKVVFAQGGLHATHKTQKIFKKSENTQLIDLDVGR